MERTRPLTLRHDHLRFKAKIKTPPTNEADGVVFMRNLIEAIGMKVADIPANPMAWLCKDLDNYGMTISGILTTSNCVIHVWDESKELQFDLYSCACFEVTNVIDLVDKFVGIEEIIWFDMTNRETGQLIDALYKIQEPVIQMEPAKFGGMTFG